MARRSCVQIGQVKPTRCHCRYIFDPPLIPETKRTLSMHSLQWREVAQETLPIMHESIRKHREKRKVRRPLHQSFPPPCLFAWMPILRDSHASESTYITDHNRPWPWYSKKRPGLSTCLKLWIAQLKPFRYKKHAVSLTLGDLHGEGGNVEKEEWKGPSRSPDREGEQCLPSAESSPPLLVERDN